MKTKFAAVPVGALLALTSVFLPQVAYATECVPQDAQPAIGEEFISVENEEYIPAWTEEIEHEAVTEVVHHDAITITIHHDAVYETVIVSPYVPAVPEIPEVPAVEATYEVEYKFVKIDWNPWHGPEIKVKWSTDPNWNSDGNPQSLGYIATGETRQGAELTPYIPAIPAVPGTPEVPEVTEQVLVTAAWDETTVITPAYDETVVVTPAWTEYIEHPAEGEEFITIVNPDYIPAKDAVVCPTPTPSVTPTPTTSATPVANVQANTPVTPAAATLPVTGSETVFWILAASALVIGGLVLITAGYTRAVRK